MMIKKSSNLVRPRTSEQKRTGRNLARNAGSVRRFTQSHYLDQRPDKGHQVNRQFVIVTVPYISAALTLLDFCNVKAVIVIGQINCYRKYH